MTGSYELPGEPPQEAPTPQSWPGSAASPQSEVPEPRSLFPPGWVPPPSQPGHPSPPRSEPPVPDQPPAAVGWPPLSPAQSPAPYTPGSWGASGQSQPVGTGPAAGGTGSGWQRLHPLTPLAVAARVIVLYALIFAEDSARGQGATGAGAIVLVVLLVVFLGLGTVRYFFTRWRFDGATLQVETGVLKRDARQLPLARVQAVDIARPFFARIFGLAEVRVRLAGHGRAGARLSYLAEPVAERLRAQLLAVHHGVSPDTPEPAETPLLSVPTERLVGSALLSGATFAAVALVMLALLLPGGGGAKGAYAGTLVVYVLGLVRGAWRKVAEQYRFTVALAPDGIRIRRGMFSTLNETVPFARVQAVRKVQPLLWRPFGWCVLEVDVAGSPGREQGTRAGRVTKALMPVGPGQQADQLLISLLGLHQFALSKPPARARWKAPASYHFLAAGTDGYVVAATTGRLRKTSVWLPLEKAQSIRWVQGPLQRRFHLATVVVDAAGRRARAALKDRSVEEAGAVYQRLVDDSRQARLRSKLK